MADGSLLINGVVQDLQTGNIEPTAIINRLGDRSQLLFREVLPYDAGTVKLEDHVQWVQDGSIIFDGSVITNSRGIAGNTTEFINLTAEGPRRALSFVNYEKSGSCRVVFNSEEGNRFDFDPDKAAKTVGFILKDILDTELSDIQALIPGFNKDDSELNALTMVSPKVVFNGANVEEAIETVLYNYPEVKWWIDSDTKRIHFRKVENFNIKSVSIVTDDATENNIENATDDTFTAAKIEGLGVLRDIDGTLNEAWDSSLENDYDFNKAQEHPDTYGRVFRAYSFPKTAFKDRIQGLGDPHAWVDYSANPGLASAIGARVWALDRNPFVDYEGGSLILSAALGAYPTGGGGFSKSGVIVKSRFTNREATLEGRFPSAGFTGSAFSQFGVEREKCIYDEQFSKEVIDGTVFFVGAQFSDGTSVDDAMSATAFTSRGLTLSPGALVGLSCVFNGGARTETITANGTTTINTDSAPTENESFEIVVRDDSIPTTIDGSLSPLEKQAKEWLAGRANVRINGDVTVSKLDFTLQLGNKINILNTADSGLTNLEAVAEVVTYDLVNKRTTLQLTNEWNLGRNL